jgi:hypothetical protein
MVSKYKDWMLQQEVSFIEEICKDRDIPNTFKDFGYRDITLEELKALDNKFINNVPEGQE